jgi:aminopeptidase N
VVRLPERVEAGRAFYLKARAASFPSETLLEGIYQDVTPPGAPQQLISQCQQWGFQRIMPVIDDCRAKCTMTTTLEGDAGYTHLISNGNVDQSRNPGGRPAPKPGEPGRQVITFHNPVPMAPYLFFVGAGTWDELADEVVYPSGKRVRLEYLAPPGRTAEAELPMKILKESVLWVERRLGYEYPFDTYRTICMTRSNFGGMENVGNTTIVTEAALIEPEHTVDATLLYAHAVIVHEFEHNQCGSQTTMATPFDMWLNEAYTVDVERRFMAERFDPAFVRLRQVDSIRDPLLGPLVLEDGGRVGRIVRQGFNDPDELVDGVTYVKAAEVIRMLRLILGAEVFQAGAERYFARYRDGNADTDQFFACFEEAAGRDLGRFKEQWLYTIGYPRVRAQGAWDPQARAYRLELGQETPQGAGPFHLPLEVALVDSQGRELPGSARVLELADQRQEVVLEGVEEEPAFASLNRGGSFYGLLERPDAALAELARQARLDPDLFNRVEAARALTDRERVRLMTGQAQAPDPGWLELWGGLLAQKAPPGVKSYLLRIEEQPLDRRYIAWYREMVAARETLQAAANRAFRRPVVEQFRGLDTYGPRSAPADGIEERQLKNVLLALLAADDSPESHGLILEHLERATTAQDRVSALAQLNRSSAPGRQEVLERTYHEWRNSLNGYANYLRCVASGTNHDVFEQIAREKARQSFDLTQPTLCRALHLPMAFNTKMVWTERGVRWLADSIIELAPVNVTTAGRLLNAFQLREQMREPLAGLATQALERIAAEVTDETSAVLHRQALAYLGRRPGRG